MTGNMFIIFVWTHTHLAWGAVAGVLLELECVTRTVADAYLTHTDTEEETLSIRYAVCLLVHPVRKHFKDESFFMSMYDSFRAPWPVDEPIIHSSYSFFRPQPHGFCGTDADGATSHSALRGTDASFQYGVLIPAQSVNLSWLRSAEGKWDYFVSMRQGLIPLSESQNQYDFDQLLFISSRFIVVLSICREEIGIWPVCVCLQYVTFAFMLAPQ